MKIYGYGMEIYFIDHKKIYFYCMKYNLWSENILDRILLHFGYHKPILLTKNKNKKLLLGLQIL